jgi:hypothetical protein
MGLILQGVTFVPRFVLRTIDQVTFARTALDKLPCLTGRASASDDDVVGLADVVPIEAARRRSVRRPAPSPAAHPAGTAPERPRSDDLPIRSYDELAASQVVPRLASLSDQERNAIRDYELAHRGRRTILGRLDQLASGR